jgi:outer membrane receptor protein involved in Fe transport
VKLIYGRGFRSPNANELFFDDGKQNAGNPGLRPEQAENVEIALDRKLRGSWSVNVSGYHMSDRRMIVPAYTADGLIQFVNAARFRGWGTGFELTGTVAGFLDINTSFQKQRAMLSGGVPANSPVDIGKIRAMAPIGEKRVYLSGALLYQSGRTTLAGASLPATYLSEATLVAKWPSEAVDARFGVRNMMNARYFDPVGLTDTVDTLVQAGRTFFLTLTFRVTAQEQEPGTKGPIRPTSNSGL